MNVGDKTEVKYQVQSSNLAKTLSLDPQEDLKERD